MEEQACLMWFLSTIAFNPQYSVNNIPVVNSYVYKCIVVELNRFSDDNNIETSGEYPFFINTDHFVEKTKSFDRKLLLTSLGITLVLSSNNDIHFENKVIPIQLTLALSFLTLEKSNTNEMQRGNSVKNNVISKGRDGLCILGFSIACKEFKRLLATNEGLTHSDAVDTKIITHAHPIILDLLKKSLNSLKFKALHCNKEFDFGHTRVADSDTSFYSIAPLFLTKAISDITISLININGQSYGQSNHMNGVSLLLKADKVIIEQDIVRTKPITGTTGNANISTSIQQEGLVGSWLTCILWEPLVRAAAASKNIYVGEIDEYFTAQGSQRCMEIISSKGVVPTINRLFLESWPTCMISLTIMSKSKLSRIIKAFEMFELASSIQQLLPTEFQHFIQFCNFVRSQLSLTYQHNNTNDSRNYNYDVFTTNVKYYLTNFFQLISLSKEKITATTKVTHTIIPSHLILILILILILLVHGKS